MIVGDRGDDQLVGLGSVAQLLELVGDLPGSADELGVDPVGDQGAVIVGPLLAAGGPTQTKESDTARITNINAWTVGVAAGQLEGAPLRFATDISRVVDDGDNLHVLPIVTRGPTENVEALLYLKGLDVAIINSDALEHR